MATAGKIMKQKLWIKKEIDARLSKNESDALWEKAQELLEDYLKEYADIPEGEHMHTDGFIFPSAAIYLTLKDAIGAEQAYDIIEAAAVKYTEAAGRKLARLTAVPGIPGLFIKVWDPMTRRMFGGSCGFQNRFYPRVKGEYRMDILACPYHKYLSLLGCPEINRIFCDNDVRTYGNLPGIEFIRTKTLGHGDEMCDFYIKKRENGRGVNR